MYERLYGMNEIDQSQQAKESTRVRQYPRPRPRQSLDQTLARVVAKVELTVLNLRDVAELATDLRPKVTSSIVSQDIRRAAIAVPSVTQFNVLWCFDL